LPSKRRVLDIGTSKILKSGIWSPYLVNMRPALSVDHGSSQSPRHQIEVRGGLLDAYGVKLEEVATKRPFKHIFGPAQAGTPLASAIGAQCGLSVLWERVGETAQYGTHQELEGVLLDGETVVIVDDVVTTGLTKATGREKIQNAGGEVLDVVAGVDRMQGGAEAVQEMGMEFSAAVNAMTIFEALSANRRITETQFDFLKEYTLAPPIYEEPADHPWKAA
jgi:orotate phosphoribosyltransferase